MKFLESFLPKLFIVLIPSPKGTYLYGELRKKGKPIKLYDLELVESTVALEKQIKKLEKESSHTYIAYLDTEAEQGLLTGCRGSEEIDQSSIEKICIDNGWGLFINKDDLFERQRSFKNIGLDFLFSPFSLLYSFYDQKVKIDDGLYLLLTGNLVVSTVFKDGAMIFAQQLFMQDELSLIDETKVLEIYIEKIQSTVKAFYDAKIDETMFIEKIFIADGLSFDTTLENRLEETLFVEVEKQSIDLAHELVMLSEKELG